ncbi:MAG: ABC transporter substrate-binding protein [Bacteroidales bacterium]|nr:ABC transporter substrate-binding protein [Bacteroidales bacterium]
MKDVVILFLSGVMMFCCTTKNSSEAKFDKPDEEFREYEIKYAKGFTIQTTENYKIITVFNPWDPPDTLSTYCIFDTNCFQETGCDFPVKLPLDRIACLASTNIAMINLLGESSKISACSDAKLICDSALYQSYLEGSVVDLGSTHLINAEMIIDHSPDLVLKYIYGAKEAADEKLIEAGLSVAYNLEFMESHPLGRAEWIKFVAAFFNKDELADSIFSNIENEYIKLVDLSSMQKNRPTVLDGSSYKGVWYTAGGNSYSAKLYADAGAEYYWRSDSNKGSIPVSFETIIDKQSDADYWFGPSTGTREDLLKIDKRYIKLKPFREGSVYFFGKKVNPHGGLDYFESGVTRPDIILKDLIWVFHPELLDSNYDPVYLEKMK